MKKIVFTGGGTAGHVFPIIALTRELKRMGFGAQLFYLGPKDEFSSLFLSQEDIEIKWVLAGKLRRYFNFKSFFQNLFDLFFKMPLGFFQSFFYVFTLTPDIIVSKGGYGSIPPVLAGWILQVPVLLHESDVTPGLANKIVSKFAANIFVSFPVSLTEYFPEEKMISIGNPIRKEITKGLAQEAKALFKLDSTKPLLLVLGGSQGAQRINNLILEILPQLLDLFELIHQTGKENLKQVKAEAKVMISKELEKYYHPIAFLSEINLKHAFRVANLVISRAGSGSIFEIAACEKPSILIPLSISAQNHQIKNAYAYSNFGAAVVMEEANLSPRFFLEKLKRLFSEPETLKKMAQKAKEFSRPDSAQHLAQYLIDCLE
ncbi:MAG: undecaprenyldiphospho-muramoylpentapeptide beta-N-acetylglucosaminyltransferase [Candidatus Nealsonbacteria bacterium]